MFFCDNLLPFCISRAAEGTRHLLVSRIGPTLHVLLFLTNLYDDLCEWISDLILQKKKLKFPSGWVIFPESLSQQIADPGFK